MSTTWNERQNVSSSYKSRTDVNYLMTQALDFLMTQDNKYLVVQDSYALKTTWTTRPNI